MTDSALKEYVFCKERWKRLPFVVQIKIFVQCQKSINRCFCKLHYKHNASQIEGCKSIFRIHTTKMPVDIKLDKDRFVEKHLVGCTGAEIAFVASEAAYNSIRRTVDIAEIFSKESSFEVSEEHIITECDFLKAVQMLKESRKRADTAKFRYNLV